MAKEVVINTEKMEEGEFLPSKGIPDTLEDGRVMTVYWTVLNGKVFTFVEVEDLLGDTQMYSGDNAEIEGERYHAFYLYGVFHGKVYPWQVELADLTPKLQRVCKAKSGAQAECNLFEKAQSLMDTIAAAECKGASASAKVAAWKVLTHIERLFTPEKLSEAIFNSRRRETLKKISGEVMDGEQISYLKSLLLGFEQSTRGKKKVRKSRKSRGGQTPLICPV